MKVVTVTWCDSTSYSRWDRRKSHEEALLARIRTTGHLLKSSRGKICVALSIDQDGDASDVVNIPRGCIEKVEVICTVPIPVKEKKPK